MPAAESFSETVQQIGEQPVKVTSYSIGDRYYCHVTNVDPDATIARAHGSSRDEAVNEAVRRATARLQPA
jgi:hypothetical protein